MKLKNYKILMLAIVAIAFQACGPTPGGFTEENIDVSNTDLTPGIQNGLCEETDEEFVFKSGGNTTYTYVFTKGGSGINDRNDDGNEDIEDQKNAEASVLNQPYACIMDVSEDSDKIVFTPKNRSLNLPVKSVRGTALVN